MGIDIVYFLFILCINLDLGLILILFKFILTIQNFYDVTLNRSICGLPFADKINEVDYLTKVNIINLFCKSCLDIDNIDRTRIMLLDVNSDITHRFLGANNNAIKLYLGFRCFIVFDFDRLN